MLRTLPAIADDKLKLTDPRVLWPILALVVTLLLAAVVLSWFDRWRKRITAPLMTPADQLNAFRLSYERGELSQEEYQRIKTKLAPKIKQQLNVPSPTPPDRTTSHPAGTPLPPPPADPDEPPR